jgi:hypothetical protein
MKVSVLFFIPFGREDRDRFNFYTSEWLKVVVKVVNGGS